MQSIAVKRSPFHNIDRVLDRNRFSLPAQAELGVKRMLQQTTSRQAVSRPAQQGRFAPFRAVNVVRSAAPLSGASTSFAGASVQSVFAVSGRASVSRAVQQVFAVKDGAVLEGRKLRVAIIGGGPSGACAAETLAKGGVEAFLIERKMDNCKVGRRGQQDAHSLQQARSRELKPAADTLCTLDLTADPAPGSSASSEQVACMYACCGRPTAVRRLPLLPMQPCGGAIPLCMVEEFDLPMEIIDRKVTKMKMISPSNRCVKPRTM